MYIVNSIQQNTQNNFSITAITTKIQCGCVFHDFEILSNKHYPSASVSALVDLIILVLRLVLLIVLVLVLILLLVLLLVL